LRCETVANTIRNLHRESSLKIWFIAFFFNFFWLGLLLVFYSGFEFLEQQPFKEYVAHYLFALYFLSLGLMLVFSNGIIIYGALYKSKESEFLMTLPLKSEHIYSYKFIETIIFSSWAFLLLGAPFLIAYGISNNLRLAFYPIAVFGMVPFAVLSSAFGTLVTMIIVTLFPQSRKKFVMLVLLVAVILLVAFSGRVLEIFDPTIRRFDATWIASALGKFRFSQAPMLPSFWLTQIVLTASEKEASGATYRELFFWFAYLISTACVLYFAGVNVAAWTLRSNYSTLSGGRRKKLYLSRAFERVLYGVFFFVGKETRHFLVKDVKNFKRDPVQWTQFLIFFGLIAFYILNLRNFAYHERSEYWRNLISFLNLTATALVLATFTSRFVFPLLSLEGKKFWILGLAPVRRNKVLWGKFLFAAIGSILISEILIVTSDLMLRTPLSWLLLHAGTMVVICTGLAGLSVGIGARFPNFAEDNPSKIVSGFGGTLNLILSMLFIGLVIMLQAIPSHIHFARTSLLFERYRFWMILSVSASLVIGAIGCIIPLYVGARAFRKVEF
jgi:ABC-2 type transport system permease protein